MAGSLIVPLDGSELGESALPWAVQLARTHGHTPVLSRAIPWPVFVPTSMGGGYVSPEVHDDILRAERETATSYLGEVQERLASHEVASESVVREGNPADVVLDLADDRGAEAIVMATHGRGGLTRVVLGSVAQRVLHETTRPVLLVRAANAPSVKIPSLDRLLVPLDGSLLAERALELASDIAARNATLVLLRVEQRGMRVEGSGPTSALVPDDEVSKRMTEQAGEYLTRLAAEVGQASRRVETDVRVGVAAAEILGAAQLHDVDLIVMSTHGRTGTARWFLGSVADEVVRKAEHPVLLVSARAIAARVVGNYTVGDVMTRDLATIRDDEPLIVALRKLLRRGVSGLPVVDAAGDLVGVLSEQDLLDWQARMIDVASKEQEVEPSTYARHLEQDSVRQIMAQPPTTIEEDAPLSAAIRLFRQRRVRRLPVTRQGKLAGILSRADVLKAMGSHWHAITGKGIYSER